MKRGETVADLVQTTPDVYDSEVRENTAALLRHLPAVLGTDDWTFRGVSLWDVVVGDFIWQHLDSAFQAADAAGQLLARTTPRRVVLLGTRTVLSEAVKATARFFNIPVEATYPRKDVLTAHTQRVRPYLGHVRDSLKTLRMRAASNGHSSFVLVNHTLRSFLVMAPVLEDLSHVIGRHRITVVQSGTEGLIEIQRTGFRCVSFEAYVPPWRGIRALWEMRRIVDRLRSGTWNRRAADHQVCFRGIPVTSLVERQICSGLPRLLANGVRMVATAEALIEREKPALVLLTEERSGLGRAVGLVAKRERVPSIMFQWGPIAPNATWLAGVTADVAAVEGEVAADVIRSCSNSADLRVVVTGQPKYERLLEEARQVSRPAVCERYGLNPRQPIVLYAAPPIYESSAAMKRNAIEETNVRLELEAVCRAFQDLAGVQLVIKPHPNEATSVQREIVEGCGVSNLRLVPKTVVVYPLLYACDVVVVHHSTVGLEGVVLGKAVVVVNLTGRRDAIPYVEAGVAVGAYTAADVLPAIRSALFDPRVRNALTASRPPFLRRHAFTDDVPATKRIVALMLDAAASRE